ncbi:MAG: ATP-binding protein [Paracoccaceae bacterium]
MTNRLRNKSERNVLKMKNTFSGDDLIFHTHFSSDPLSAARVTEELIGTISNWCVTTGSLANIEIVVTEVINNIIEHAYLEDPDQPIEISAKAGSESVQFDLIDCGKCMPESQIPNGRQMDLTGAVCDLPEGGFGWHLIRSLAQNLNYTRDSGKNHLTFSVTIGQQ